MAIYIMGDIHGEISINRLSVKNFPDQKKLTKDDIVIICGDFGLLWNGGKSERYWLNWLHKDKSFTTLFVDGNHENFEMINNLPIEVKFGGKVHKVNDSVFHLMRGEFYKIQGETFFAMGGAESTDKIYRKDRISWWKEELPNKQEFENAMDNLNRNNNKVDYIISHCISNTMENYFVRGGRSKNDLTNFFEHIIEEDVDFKHWYFGHYHQDLEIDKYTCVYKNILKIK